MRSVSSPPSGFSSPAGSSPGTSAGARHRPFPALVGAVAYGFTGYLVGWASWPQSNVAAFAPALLWSVESLVSEPRPRRAVPVAGAIAALYLSNFPPRRDLCRDRRCALRHRATHCVARRPPAPPRRAVGAAADDLGSGRRCARHGCDLDLSLGVHDLPRRQRHELPGRQTGRLQHRHPLSVDPRAPCVPAQPTRCRVWADGTNWIEAQGYVGASVLLLALLALAYRRGPDRDLAAAVRILWGIAIFGMWISYVGGPLTEALQSLPLLGGNSIGRSRRDPSAVAALAGLGTQALIDRADDHVDLRRAIRNGAIVAAIAGLAFSPWLVDWKRGPRPRRAADHDRTGLAARARRYRHDRGDCRRGPREQIGPALIGNVSLIVSVELLGFGYSVITVVDADEGRYETASARTRPRPARTRRTPRR